MLKNLVELKEEEKQLMIDAPLYVSILLAGADGEINSDEKKRTIELVHVKTYSETPALRDLYHEVEIDAQHRLNELLASLPDDLAARNEKLSSILEKINTILPKLEFHFAHRYYKSLRDFAHYVAETGGGFWKVGSVGEAEKVWVKLPMIQEPVKPVE